MLLVYANASKVQQLTLLKGHASGAKSEYLLLFQATDCINIIRVRITQDAFPELSAGEREFLISGYCNTCFDEVFADE